MKSITTRLPILLLEIVFFGVASSLAQSSMTFF